MSSAQSALVIGGGIAGPVTAAALVKAGIEATVYEAYPGPSDGIGGSLALEPNGLGALAIIDADNAVQTAAMPVTRSIMSISSRHLIEVPRFDDLPPRQLIERGTLHRILHDQACASGVRFEYGKRLVGVDERPDAITARFADGTKATGDVLIGADGVRSRVRTLIDREAPGAKYTGLLGFEGLVDVDVDLAPGTMTFAFGRSAYYLYWVRRDGKIGWGANLPSTQYLSLTDARAVPAADWVRTLRDTYADDDPGSALAEATTEQTLQVVGALHIMPPVPHWHRGRMVLVGDAVHAPSNSTGQGASLAIESAIVLARCLRDSPDIASAFSAYEELRRDRVEKIAGRGARINHAKTPGPIARRLMRVALPLMFKTMNLEKSMGAEQRYVIDWATPELQPNAGL
jgi:2-polyprenyl-6-methoxyphenol hydroxylase-like FAD-dependent oxidoreductase